MLEYISALCYIIKITMFVFCKGTPVLNRKMTLRRETLKALETRRNSVMAERRKSQMQTLGANNEYGVTGMVISQPFS